MDGERVTEAFLFWERGYELESVSLTVEAQVGREQADEVGVDWEGSDSEARRGALGSVVKGGVKTRVVATGRTSVAKADDIQHGR